MEKFEKYIQSEINEFEENSNLFSQSSKKAVWDKLSGNKKRIMGINYKLLFFIAASFFLLSGSSIVIMHLVYTKNFEQLSNFNEKLLHEIHAQKSTYQKEIYALEEDISDKSNYIVQLTHDIDSAKSINRAKEDKKNIKSRKTKPNQTKKKHEKKNNIKIQINNIPFAEHLNADTNYVAEIQPDESVENEIPKPDKDQITETAEKIFIRTESNIPRPAAEKKRKSLKIQFGNISKQVSFSKQRLAGIKTSM